MTSTRTDCPPLELRITKSLLGYGVIVGPIYVLSATIQAVARSGFDPTRHDVSLLANGNLGWIQSLTFVLAGAMTIAAAVGIARALRLDAKLASSLIAVYGAGLVGAGVFRADPAYGFPLGSPADHAPVSWHGGLHILCAGVGFSCLIAACAVVARYCHQRDQPRWAWYCACTATLLAAGFAAIASLPASAAAVLLLTVAVINTWVWLAAFSLKLYREA
jgi:Protein of unknown function (DUF998)